MTSIAKLNGLVLSGGKSTRMGTDKGLIEYHKIPQREHLYQLLSEVCAQTFISLRADQEKNTPFGFATIADEDKFRGPFNGILSAHSFDQDAAWLVLACDLPLIDLPALIELIEARDADKFATAFANEENPLAEPLCAIWEPHALKKAINYLTAGNGSCPRKFLINNDTKLVFPKNKNVILNANSEAEYKEALVKLSEI
ncbi:NTP transferase domain-containing protein [Aurantibacter crassamenti]|uniref:NTP transferase domain-containing protein n=1 Tax=Aurantibacter crassamenti TaxID=1837375 RepID=UPI001939885A|nr:NTP transferase domain-containing protein [Aurantibacter crassamenti]MBM1106679.1 NTP transferase domain-containing protein [Aurantibacter crassamenti]